MSTTIAQIRDSYGINKRINGDFDSRLAVRCENGTFAGRENKGVLSFLGVPFAKPPVGGLRWKRPEPPEPDDGVYEAYYNGKTPIQTQIDSERASYYPQGEDCLYINIWLNSECEDTDKSVMVFFHGGSYGWGGTADPLYNGHNFVASHPDIILITAAYRVGLMGFADFSSVDGGGEFPDAPNLGILDQIEALRWIQKNIKGFGGDPENVTIFGESAGGGSVSLLPIIAEAKGLFKRVIAQSGSVALTFSKEECRDYTRKLLKGAKAGSMAELMKLTEGEIIQLNKKLDLENNFPQRDGRIIPLDPYGAYENGLTADVDMLIGTNSNEMNYWIGELGGVVPFRFGIPVKFENDLRHFTPEDKARVKRFMSLKKSHSMWRIAEFYNEIMFRLPAIRQADAHTHNGGKAYMYYWTEPSAIYLRGACHAVELAYVFGNTDETIYTGMPADKSLSDTVMDMWANFARTGDPSLKDLKWEPYDIESRSTMVISNKPELKNDVLKKQRELLFPLLRYMINASYTELDLNVPFVYKTAVRVLALTAVGFAAAFGIRKLIKKKK